MNITKLIKAGIPIIIASIAGLIISLFVVLSDISQLYLPDIMPNFYVLGIIGGIIIITGCVVFFRVGLLKSKKLYLLFVILNVLSMLYVYLFAFINYITIALLVIFMIIIIDLFILIDDKLGHFVWIYFLGFVFKVYILVLNYAIVMLN